MASGERTSGEVLSHPALPPPLGRPSTDTEARHRPTRSLRRMRVGYGALLAAVVAAPLGGIAAMALLLALHHGPAAGATPPAASAAPVTTAPAVALNDPKQAVVLELSVGGDKGERRTLVRLRPGADGNLVMDEPDVSARVTR
jgi:hypothetical protein